MTIIVEQVPVPLWVSFAAALATATRLAIHVATKRWRDRDRLPR